MKRIGAYAVSNIADAIPANIGLNSISYLEYKNLSYFSSCQ